MPGKSRQLLLLLIEAICLGRNVAVKNNVPSRPHLLFMMADQLRWDALSHVARSTNKAARTPAIDRLAAEGISIRYSFSSTPTCTPARAALLTGRSPWRHGMLGYGNIAPHYSIEMPRLLSSAGYRTATIGKDHFGGPASSLAHGYQQASLYDGLGHWSPTANNSWVGEFDTYDQWFQTKMPGKDPQATLDSLDGDGWNSWHGRAYVYDESLHPTTWVGQNAVKFIRSYSNATDAQPFFLKVSFHRPHSPYDPPARVLDTVRAEDLPPVKLCKGATSPGSTSDDHGDNWCLRFRGHSGDPSGCGSTPDAWCGEMPVNDTTLSRRAYTASVNFVDEWVGRIYDALVEKNLLERTWILWTADHGDGQGDMYHWRKGYPYEFSAHVPMLLRWPQAWADAQPHASIVARGTTLEPPLVAELRDVLHTMADAAGIAHNASLIPPIRVASMGFAPEDGRSLLCLLRDPSGTSDCDYPPNPGPWRRWIDMEHATCYNMTNHWSALTDGRMKYIYRAWANDEQLFNLTADPAETTDVSSLTEYASELLLWRNRLVHQFESEGRGPDWVQNKTLVRRTKQQTYSPNYPSAVEAVVFV
eukprot:TRINITY_DN57425_c0_g1_i1.p1 TRINITY_DN57425_c0_g1~~TRINITY_DN57425_c0_g1_i1.p1  ORF type:complete len:588 (+),score=47.09 TRINITY_DN57425_c0_g1_i1:75-1838(+)